MISIVIPAYNYAEYLEEAINSALNQTIPCEVIVVNDGSTDDTDKIAKSFGKRIVYISQKNAGLSATRNVGIKAATGKYIIPLDADDMLLPDSAEKYLEKMHEGVGIVRSGYQEFGDSNKIQIWNNKVSYYTLRLANCITATALFPKEIWEEVGGYDENMKDGYEDWEFWIRIVKAGYTVETIEKPMFLYRKHGISMLDGSNEKVASIIEYMWTKHMVEGGRILYVDTPDINLLNGVKYYRMLVPMKALEKIGFRVKVCNELAVKDASGNLTLIADDIDWADIIVLPRYFDSSPNIVVAIVQYAKSLGKTIVYETDDYLHEIPEHNQSAELINIESTQRLIKFMEENADIKTVTTRKLAELLDAEICPNSVDMDLWGNLENQKIPGKFRIGWSGGWTHKKDLEMIVPVIQRLKKKYQFEFVIHGFDPGIPKSSLYYKLYPQSSVLSYPDAISKLGLDIAIAPLVDDEFNQYKSNIKWLEAAMLKIPFVATNLPPYEDIKDGEDGFLATTLAEWEEKLEMLIIDEGLRRRMGQKAYDRVSKEYNIDNTVEAWVRAYSKCQK